MKYILFNTKIIQAFVLLVMLLGFGELSYGQQQAGLIDQPSYSARLSFPAKQPRVSSDYADVARIVPEAYPQEKGLNSLVVFPNPANQSVEVVLDGVELKGFALELFDHMGMVVLRMDPWDGSPLDVSRLDRGTYLLLLRKDHEYYSQKLLIER